MSDNIKPAEPQGDAQVCTCGISSAEQDPKYAPRIHSYTCPLSGSARPSKEQVEIMLLRSRLRTIHLAEVFSGNAEVTKRLAELENTSDQARQYVQNAQAREHRIHELEDALQAAEQRATRAALEVGFRNGWGAAMSDQHFDQALEKCRALSAPAQTPSEVSSFPEASDHDQIPDAFAQHDRLAAFRALAEKLEATAVSIGSQDEYSQGLRKAYRISRELLAALIAQEEGSK